MSDSVGKISLDLEVQSDLQGQLTKLSNNIGNSIKSSLNAGTNKIFENMNSGLKSSTKVLENNLVNSIGKMKSNLTSSFKAMFSSLKNVKMPTLDFGKPENQATPKTTTNGNINKTRGSPINSEILKTEIDNTAAALDVINRKIEQQQSKLLELKESYNTTFNQARKNKVEEQMLKTEASITKLIGQSDKLGFKLSDLDAKFASLGTTSKATGNKIGLFNTISKNADTVSRKLSNSIKSVGDNVKKSNNNTRSFSNGIGMVAKQFLTWMVILPMIMKGLKAMTTGLYNNLMTNSQFANSLAQIKTNLSVAFTPIYNAILPAINSLMSALSKATQYIASFISSIFGKTYQQSYQATQGLISAKTAMGAYGDSASTAAKQAKEAQGSLMGFDEINQLDINSSADTGDTGNTGVGGSEVPTLVSPAMDTAAIDSSMKSLVDRIKGYFGTFDFSNLINAFENLKSSIAPIISIIGENLKWFWEEILNPFAHWAISDAIPAFFDLLSGALNVLEPIMEAFKNSGQWLWDNFLQPIASWTGGVIVSILEGLADTLTSIGDWMSEHQPIVENFALVIQSFAIAWALVNVAIGVWNVVGAIATGVTSAFGAAVAFLTSPIGIVIVAIGAIIAIVLLLIKNWDWVKEKAIEVWNKIVETWNTVAGWFSDNVITPLKEFFSGLWTKITEIFGGVKDWFTQKFTDAWNGIKNVFSGVGSFFGGLWDVIKEKFTSIGSAIGNAIGDAFKYVVNSIIRFAENTINGFIVAINAAIGLINKIPGVEISKINTIEIPKLAKGGVLDQPTLAMVGEAGKEAVVPLENNTQGLDLLANKLLERMPQSNSNDSSISGDLTLIIDGSVIGKVALNQLRKMQRQGNITLIPT